MMRYKPKLPLYGGTLTEKKKREFGNANYKINQLLGGGPIEKAIRQDLISLRGIFHEEIVKNRQKDHEGEQRDRFDSHLTKQQNNLYTSSYRRRQRLSSQNNICVIDHKPDGYSFQIFQNVYKKAKFGIIFTRAAPKNTRIDREAFVQLIFSTVLSLLKDAILSMEKKNMGIGSNATNECNDESLDRMSRQMASSATSNNDREETQRKENEMNYDDDESTSYFNAVFAIYALYTLYKTNPAPHVPIDYDSEDDTTDNQKNDSITESNEKYALTPREAKFLSTLPIGLTDTVTDSEARFYRRSYHSPIRISYQSFQFLIRIRKLSLIRMDDCRIAKYSILKKKYDKKKDFDALMCSSSSSSEEDDCNDGQDKQAYNRASCDSVKCSCSMANDCIALIDRLISDQCFSYCEYDGPVSVESYCGTDMYVRSAILGEEKSSNVVVPVDNRQGLSMLEEINDVDASIAQLDLAQVQSSLNEYQNLMGQTSMMIQMKSNDKLLQKNTIKNQLSLIQNTMKPVMKERHRRQKVSLVEQIEKILTSDSTDSTNQNEINVGAYDANIDEDATVTGFESNSDLDGDTSGTNHNRRDEKSMRFIYPESFSKSLKDGLERVLEDIILLDKEDKKSIQGQKGNKQTARKGRIKEPIEDDFLDVGSLLGQDDFHQEENNYEDFDDMKSIATLETEHAGGAGNAALQLLLSKAMEVSARSIQKKTLGTRKRGLAKTSEEENNICVGNPLKQRKMGDRQRTLIEDDGDELSLNTGVSATCSIFGEQGSLHVEESGRTALQALLSKASQEGSEKKSKISMPKTRKRAKTTGSNLPKVSHLSSNEEEKSFPEKSEMIDLASDDVSHCSKSSVITNMTGNVGAGTIALQQLLRKAEKVSGKGTSSKTMKGKGKLIGKTIPRSSTQKNHNEKDDISICSKSSIMTDINSKAGTGSLALQQLIQKVSKTPNVSSRRDKDQAKVNVTENLVAHVANDDLSICNKSSIETNTSKTDESLAMRRENDQLPNLRR